MSAAEWLLLCCPACCLLLACYLLLLAAAGEVKRASWILTVTVLATWLTGWLLWTLTVTTCCWLRWTLVLLVKSTCKILKQSIVSTSFKGCFYIIFISVQIFILWYYWICEVIPPALQGLGQVPELVCLCMLLNYSFRLRLEWYNYKFLICIVYAIELFVSPSIRVVYKLLIS